MRHPRGIQLVPSELSQIDPTSVREHDGVQLDTVNHWDILGGACVRCSHYSWVNRHELLRKWGNHYLRTLRPYLSCTRCQNKGNNQWLVGRKSKWIVAAGHTAEVSLQGTHIEIVIPDVDAMTDVDIEDFVLRRDGKWSLQTQNLLRRHQTDRLNLNAAWANTPPSWKCPSCQRTKPQIARKSSSGVLLCQLESHHDHLNDAAAQIFREHNPPTEDRRTNVQQDQAKYAILTLTERFQPTIICLDCNLVEGKVKSALGLPPHFSFSPQEIADFVRPHDNRVHEYDENCAQTIWSQVSSDVTERLNFATGMAKRVSNGRHRRQPNVGERMAAEYVSYDIVLHRLLAPTGHEQTLRDATHKLLARSVSRDAVGKSQNPKPKPPGRMPTDEEFAGINKQNSKQKHWNLVPTDWKCRCCNRSRREICRISNQRKWTARIHGMREWVFEKTYKDATWRETPEEGRTIVDHRPVRVCQDCRDIVSEVQKRDASFSPSCLTIDDIVACIVDVGNNRPHEVDYDLAFERAKGNSDLEAEVRAYREFEVLARNYIERLKSFMISKRCSAEDATDHFIYEHVKKYRVDLDEAREAVEWLLANGRRFQALGDRG